MPDVLKLIQLRQSTRVRFNPSRPIPKRSLARIVEAARWAPTAHNMQNFEIIVVDDKRTLKELGAIRSRISADFLRESYEQLSFSKEEFLRKKVGVLATSFPPKWRQPSKFEEVSRESAPVPLEQSINGSPALFVVVYDPRKRAPASEGDVLGMMSLGCVMENVWLTAQSLGLGFQIVSVFAGEQVAKTVKRILGIPEPLRIAFAARLGYPLAKPPTYLRVRRDPGVVAHYNRYGTA